MAKQQQQQKTRIANTFLYNKRTSGSITIPGFKLYYRTIVKTAWFGLKKNRELDQWNQIENPDKSPYTYGHLNLKKRSQNYTMVKKTIFNKWCWSNCMLACRRMEIDSYLSPCTKLKSMWIKDLNIKPDTLNLIEEKAGNNLERHWHRRQLPEQNTNSIGTKINN